MSAPHLFLARTPAQEIDDDTAHTGPSLADCSGAGADVPASASRFAQQGEFATKARNAILLDYDSGSVLFQKAADDLVPPASMSKLMTLAVLFKALKDGKVKLEDELLTSENAWRTGGAPSGTSAMFISASTHARPSSELIQGIIVQSGNDACITVAEGLGGQRPQLRQADGGGSPPHRPHEIDVSQFDRLAQDPEHLMTARELAHARELPDQGIP